MSCPSLFFVPCRHFPGEAMLHKELFSTLQRPSQDTVVIITVSRGTDRLLAVGRSPAVSRAHVGAQGPSHVVSGFPQTPGSSADCCRSPSFLKAVLAACFTFGQIEILSKLKECMGGTSPSPPASTGFPNNPWADGHGHVSP